ncbi:hypothetical protein [Gemmatimonas sp.]|uniref:hypothetical protein n=1 Tax=Gemmatimonas sp. TaxID=1962908 RepID=UPI00286CBAC9|nr:hypothetical protein [Gemmatimonas sp.]
MTDQSAAAPEPTNTDAVQLWQNQSIPAYRLSPTALATVEYEHTRLRVGVTIKSAVMLLGLVFAVYKAVTVDQALLRLGAVAFAIAFGRVLYTLQRTRRGDTETIAADRAGAGLAAPLLVHYRAALVRERDRLSGRRLWMPFAISIPAGFAVMIILARTQPVLERYLAIELTVFSTAMPLALLYGRWQGRRYQAHIDLLDAFTSEPH